MGPIAKKTGFGVSNHVMLKLACLASETTQKLEILPQESLAIILFRKGITKALIRLRGCAVWSAPLLLSCVKVRFSQVKAHISIPVLLFLFQKIFETSQEDK